MVQIGGVALPLRRLAWCAGPPKRGVWPGAEGNTFIAGRVGSGRVPRRAGSGTTMGRAAPAPVAPGSGGRTSCELAGVAHGQVMCLPRSQKGPPPAASEHAGRGGGPGTGAPTVQAACAGRKLQGALHCLAAQHGWHTWLACAAQRAQRSAAASVQALQHQVNHQLQRALGGRVGQARQGGEGEIALLARQRARSAGRRGGGWNGKGGWALRW